MQGILGKWSEILQKFPVVPLREHSCTSGYQNRQSCSRGHVDSKGQGKLSLPGGGKPVLRLPGSTADPSNTSGWKRSFAGFPQENEEREKIDLRREE